MAILQSDVSPLGECRIMKLTLKERAAGWCAFWAMTGYFIGYEASAFANGVPRDYGMIEGLGVASLATVFVTLMRSRVS